MKYLTSNKKRGTKNKTYYVYLKVTDNDIRNLEDLVYCNNKGKKKEKLDKWLKRSCGEFEKIWRHCD